MAKVWVATYYVANKWGSMQERTRTYGTSLTEHEVRVKIDKMLAQKRAAGQPIYPQYDLTKELVA